MRKTPSLFFAAGLLALGSLAQARPIAPETIPGLAKKADYLVVGQVLKIEDAGEEQSDTWKMPIVRKRVTIRVVRGIRSADASAVAFNQVVVEYAAAKNGIPADGPQFPRFELGQTAVFPLKQGAEGAPWKFVSEEDFGMFAPAVAQEIAAGWPANIDGNIAFFYRELAGAFLYGDFGTMSRAGGYLNLVAGKDQPVDSVFGLIRAEIGDNLLREDTRWVSIGAAAYIASGTPRPTLDALINGMIGGAAGAARAPTDGLPTVPALRMAALSLRKAGKFQLGERILMLLISHQEEEGLAWGVAKALIDNFNGEPMMISMEQQLIRAGKPGAMYVADYMVKDREHPLAAAAAEGARQALAMDGAARLIPENVPFTPLLRESEGLLLRAGSDEDFAFLLEQINQTRLHDARTYQALLLLAGDSELSPPARVLEICRQYIDDTAAMPSAPWPGFRLCDMAALTAARIGKQDFGLKLDDAAKRDEAVARAREWLKVKPAK